MRSAQRARISDERSLESGPKEEGIDINQFELAIINRALRGDREAAKRLTVDIGNSDRILRIQKRNLSALLRDLGRPSDARTLERALQMILSGHSSLRLIGKAPKHDS